MESLHNVFLVDSLSNLDALAALSPNFAKAVAFIRSHDLRSLAPGRTPIDGDAVFVNCDEIDYVAPERRRPEVHRRYFDVHVPLTDDERIGLAVFDARANGSFDEAKDIGFYDQAFNWHDVRLGSFCLTWPVTCVHVPAVTPDVPKRARKLVFKVRA